MDGVMACRAHRDHVAPVVRLVDRPLPDVVQVSSGNGTPGVCALAAGLVAEGLPGRGRDAGAVSRHCAVLAAAADCALDPLTTTLTRRPCSRPFFEAACGQALAG